MDPVEHAVNSILAPPLSETSHLAWLNREYSKLMRRELEVAAREARMRPRAPIPIADMPPPPRPQPMESNIPARPRWGDMDGE